MLDDAGRAELSEIATQADRRGHRVRRPGVALALAGIARSGRASFYEGAFGSGLAELGDGLFDDDDLRRKQADWVEPLSAPAFGVDLHTIGANSQAIGAMTNNSNTAPAKKMRIKTSATPDASRRLPAFHKSSALGTGSGSSSEPFSSRRR